MQDSGPIYILYHVYIYICMYTYIICTFLIYNYICIYLLIYSTCILTYPCSVPSIQSSQIGLQVLEPKVSTGNEMDKEAHLLTVLRESCSVLATFTPIQNSMKQ